MTKRELKDLVRRYQDVIETIGGVSKEKFDASEEEEELGALRFQLKDNYVSALDLETSFVEYDYETLRVKLHTSLKLDQEKFNQIQELIANIKQAKCDLMDELSKNLIK